eukprot:CAMPEP_0168701904 /NCGR_PEP_ID=MMETSP0503-20121227/38250_1 /TAXON_ID=89963 /ORGANISM="Heterocapsa rotundata, Strain SCCAP K-0483" /LENGTH=57 /DNA_ID=CAMNT_0008747995 /DNA_START=1 /DNA_END=177 /DNA_ORIENTATION=-
MARAWLVGELEWNECASASAGELTQEHIATHAATCAFRRDAVWWVHGGTPIRAHSYP